MTKRIKETVEWVKKKIANFFLKLKMKLLDRLYDDEGNNYWY